VVRRRRVGRALSGSLASVAATAEGKSALLRITASQVPRLFSELSNVVAGLCTRALAIQRLSAKHRPNVPLAPEIAALASAQISHLGAPLEAEERARQLADLRDLMPDIHLRNGSEPAAAADRHAELIIGKAARARVASEAAASVALRFSAPDESASAVFESPGSSP
jgi:hypothetical protein